MRSRRLAPALAILGATMLVVAELTPLLRVNTIAAHPRLVRTVQTGPHHAWALVPIAVAAVLVAAGAMRAGSRLAMGALAVLGLAGLGVALIADLPSVHTTGVVGSPGHGLTNAEAQAALGLYLETLGSVVLLVAGAAGALLTPAGARRPRRSDAGKVNRPQPE